MFYFTCNHGLIPVMQRCASVPQEYAFSIYVTIFREAQRAKCKETVYVCMDIFGCFGVSNIVKQRKSKFLHKFILLKKGADLYGQFVSVAERELAALWYCGLFDIFTCWFLCFFVLCVIYLSATRFWWIKLCVKILENILEVVTCKIKHWNIFVNVLQCFILHVTTVLQCDALRNVTLRSVLLACWWKLCLSYAICDAGASISIIFNYSLLPGAVLPILSLASSFVRHWIAYNNYCADVPLSNYSLTFVRHLRSSDSISQEVSHVCGCDSASSI